MNSYVLIIRQGAQPLSDDDRKQMTARVPGWVRQELVGRNLEPRILAAPRNNLLLGRGSTGDTVVGRPVAALLFFEAADFPEAVRIAETHPALDFDVSIEVRTWTAPVPAPVESP